MSRSLLTIAMAVYRSFDSFWFTVQDLRKSHGYDFEMLCIDNAPESCIRTRTVCGATRTRYIHRPDLNGTSRPRNAAFHYATTPWVMVIDDHVLLDLGAVEAAIAYARQHPNSRDIISGPIMGDDGRWAATHWKPEVASGMWGTWDATIEFRKRWGDTGRPEWNHRSARAAVDRMEPFEIPSMGLGLWMMRKAAWPEFNPHFRSFGGEEGYIHEKVRQLGGQAVCHPKIRWHHKFRDIGGVHDNVPYPLTLNGHIRNILIGARELGLSEVEEEVRTNHQFGPKLVAGEFDKLVAEATRLQPVGQIYTRRPLKILGLWYTNNSAPPQLLQRSLGTVVEAQMGTTHDIRIGTCAWEPVAKNPFPQVLAGDWVRSLSGHSAIIQQIRAAWRVGQGEDDWRPDVVCFLEHDVLYAPGYFDRIGNEFAADPDLQVVSHLDYIGLNETGWLRVRPGGMHLDRGVWRAEAVFEPLHQIGMRADTARKNLDRCELECRQTGQANFEPDFVPREQWKRIAPEGFAPSVHVNHRGLAGRRRLTNHGEVVFETVSTMGRNQSPLHLHPYWGVREIWWPEALEPTTTKEANMACGGCGSGGQPCPHANLMTWFEAEKKAPPDFHGHMDTLRELAGSVRHATEMSTWPKQAYLAIAAGMPGDGVLVSCSPGAKSWWGWMGQLMGVRFKTNPGNSVEATIEPTELLFIDSAHTAERTYAELQRHADKVSKYIVIHTVAADTFGHKGDDGGPGVMPGLRRWLREGADKEWVVKRYDDHNHGLIVLSRDPADRPPVHQGIRSGLRFVRAQIRHKLNGGAYLPLPLALERLDVCLVCPKRGGADGGNCVTCKCFLARVPDNATVNAGGPGKIFFPLESCPEARWTERPNDGVHMTEEEVAAMLTELEATGA